MACALEVLGRDALGKCRVLLTMRYKIIVYELDSLSGVTNLVTLWMSLDSKRG